MKFPASEPVSVLRGGEVRRDLQVLLRYAALLVAVIALYAVLFQVIMLQVEGQSTLVDHRRLLDADPR